MGPNRMALATATSSISAIRGCSEAGMAPSEVTDDVATM